MRTPTKANLKNRSRVKVSHMSQLMSVRETTTQHVSINGFDSGLLRANGDSDAINRIDTVMEVLRRSDGCGIVLAGEFGVGKTHLLREAQLLSSQESHVVSLRCSSGLAHVKLGTLSPLLGDVSENYLENLHLVTRTVTRVLLAAAGGKPIVLFIDNVQNLDEESALVVTQLAVNKTVSLVLACSSLVQTPAEIVSLWRDGMIYRLDLLPLTESEAPGWLKESLGGQVSMAAAQALWRIGGGNPRFMSALVQEQIEAGTLLNRDGVWVVSGADLVCGNSCVDSVMTAVGALCAEEQLVAELLAVSGGMALNHLMGICSAVAVDALQKRGYLKISQAEQVGVRLAMPLMEEVLRNRVPVGRSRELRQWAVGDDADSARSGIAAYRLASWTTECGMEIEPNQALLAARDATNEGHPTLGLRILTTQSRRISAAAAGLETARALMAKGEHLGAERLMSSPLLDDPNLDIATWLEVRLMRSSLARIQPQIGVDARTLLDEVAARLFELAQANGGHDPLDEVPDLREELALVMAQQAMHEGKYREPEVVLEGLRRSARQLRVRYMATLALIEVKALTGRAHSAAALAEGLNNSAEFNADIVPLRGAPLTMAVAASILAELTGHRMMRTSTGTFVGARVAGFSELAEGVTATFDGHADAALKRLIPATSQLEQLSEPAAVRLGYAAAAYAYTLKGDDEAALASLRRSESKATSASRLMNTVCSYFQVLASAELASKEKALIRLFALADEEKRFGCSSVELLFVAAAVRLGALTAARRMVDLADVVQGELSTIYAGFGRGLGEQDTTQLLAMAELATAHDEDLLSRDIARTALRIAKECADKDAIRQAQRVIRAGVAKLGKVKVTAEDGQVLTGREQEIAVQAAGGVSNKSIAAKMHISVRTVEGHLYQIYSKLQVSSRTELRETIS